jgi:hypothetical protein
MFQLFDEKTAAQGVGRVTCYQREIGNGCFSIHDQGQRNTV